MQVMSSGVLIGLRLRQVMLAFVGGNWIWRAMLAGWLGCWTLAAAAPVQRLDIGLEGGTPWILLRGTGPTNQVYRLVRSPNLINWEELAVLHDAPFVYPEHDSTTLDRRFYRFEVWPKTEE